MRRPTATAAALSPPDDRAVEFALDGRGPATEEAFVERVRRGDARVEVDVLLADGSGGVAELEHGEWDWLEVRAGDIVRVRPLPWVTVSA